jgi:hypothetical protein
MARGIALIILSLALEAGFLLTAAVAARPAPAGGLAAQSAPHPSLVAVR